MCSLWRAVKVPSYNGKNSTHARKQERRLPPTCDATVQGADVMQSSILRAKQNQPPPTKRSPTQKTGDQSRATFCPRLSVREPLRQATQPGRGLDCNTFYMSSGCAQSPAKVNICWLREKQGNPKGQKGNKRQLWLSSLKCPSSRADCGKKLNIARGTHPRTRLPSSMPPGLA